MRLHALWTNPLSGELCARMTPLWAWSRVAQKIGRRNGERGDRSKFFTPKPVRFVADGPLAMNRPPTTTANVVLRQA